jgi:hypothetical protein
MKKHLITLIVAASAAIHAQAAELATQLQGYWQPDMEKTAALAKKEGRDENPEENPMALALMGKMVFEFQNDKMTIHPPAGGKFNGAPPPLEYKVIAEDKAAKALTLSIDGEETKIRFNKEQMAMSDKKEGGWMILNRMSKEDFAKRKPALAEILKEDAPAAGEPEDVTGQPIPEKPATGRIDGKDFKVEKAVLENSVLTLRQGKDFFADLEFMVFLFGQDGKFEGKTIAVKPNQDSTTAHIHKGYKVEGKNLPETEIITEKYTMKVEFGTAKDGKIPGKIHLRLPDEAGSFVVGTFEAEIK